MLSSGSRVSRIVNAPYPLIDPAMTEDPVAFSTGLDSPATIDSSISEAPEITVPRHLSAVIRLIQSMGYSKPELHVHFAASKCICACIFSSSYANARISMAGRYSVTRYRECLRAHFHVAESGLVVYINVHSTFQSICWVLLDSVFYCLSIMYL